MMSTANVTIARISGHGREDAFGVTAGRERRLGLDLADELDPLDLAPGTLRGEARWQTILC